MEKANQSKISAGDMFNISGKLTALRDTLPAAEQLALDKIMELVSAGAKLSTEPSVRELLADLPDASEILDEVAGFDDVQGFLLPPICIENPLISRIYSAHPTFCP